MPAESALCNQASLGSACLVGHRDGPSGVECHGPHHRLRAGARVIKSARAVSETQWQAAGQCSSDPLTPTVTVTVAQ